MPQPLATPPKSIIPHPIRKGIDLHVNGEAFRHTGNPAMPLLWYLRDVLRLTGTKVACDGEDCGACTVLVDGKPTRACRMPMSKLSTHAVTTVEGLADSDGILHPLQQAFIDQDAIQCGYCVPGQLLAGVALLKRTPQPSDADIDKITNLCRCGIYPRFRAAIKQAATTLHKDHK